MQLVKNVFLTREKTLSRKLEEVLLVYILENNRISSKERMLEVYFNIIEWCPQELKSLFATSNYSGIFAVGLQTILTFLQCQIAT